MVEEVEYKVEGLNELSKQFSDFQTRMGFTDSNKTQRLMLIVSEISEAFEAYRKDKYADMDAFKNHLIVDQFKTSFENWIKDTFEDELADIGIRFLAFCGENNIDIEKHIKLKMKYNELRGYKYGGKKF